MTVFKSCTGVLAGLLLAASGAVALAQTTAPAAPALPQTAPSADTTVVTIFGHRQSLLSDKAIFTIDTQHGSSCGFSVGVGRHTFLGTHHMRNNAPFGDASQSGPPMDAPGMGLNMPNVAWEALDHRGFYDRQDFAAHAAGQGGACTPSDFAAAAARSEIAMHDHSFKDAMDAYNAGDFAKALPLFKTAYAKMGFPDAADMEGQMYLLGLGTPRDTAQAIVWLTKATDGFRPGMDEQRFFPDTPEIMNGRTEAAMTLGKIYATGLDVPADPKKARHWFGNADEFGYIPAAHLLGILDESAYGGEGSLKSAVAHLTRAGTIGYAPSEYELGVIYYNGGDGVPQDKAEAGAWLVQAAKRGHPDALYAVGRMYDLGEGGAGVDPQRALVYYKEAAVKGQPDAQNAIGLSFYLGQGVPKDPAIARTWFQHAAEGDVPDAMFNYAVMLANGEGGKADLASAYAWMRLAQKEGLDKAAAAADELAAKLSPEERARAEAALNPQVKP